jgi:CheY-like chemotaxis protein
MGDLDQTRNIVLVADDEALIRIALLESIEYCFPGLDVRQAANEQAALALINEFAGRILAVITDMNFTDAEERGGINIVNAALHNKIPHIAVHSSKPGELPDGVTLIRKPSGDLDAKIKGFLAS